MFLCKPYNFKILLGKSWNWKMLVWDVNAFPVFNGTAIQGQKPKFSIFLFNYLRSNFSIINVDLVFNAHFVIEIMIETDFFPVEAYFQNVSFTKDLLLSCPDSDFWPLNINYNWDIRNFTHSFYNGFVLSEISISGVYPYAVHASLEHFFNHLL